jgi:hypothetical protein
MAYVEYAESLWESKRSDAAVTAQLRKVGTFGSSLSGTTSLRFFRLLQVFEDAIAAMGLHCSAGHALWAAYRAFERKCAGAVLDAKTAEKIRSLFRRELTLPLIGGISLVSFVCSERAQTVAECCARVSCRHGAFVERI